MVVAHPQGDEREEVEEGVEVRQPHRLDELAVVGEGVEAQRELKERLLDDRVVVVVVEGVRMVRVVRVVRVVWTVWTVWAVER